MIQEGQFLGDAGVLQVCNPNIILASETCLNPTIARREVLPANYKFVARTDPTAV